MVDAQAVVELHASFQAVVDHAFLEVGLDRLVPSYLEVESCLEEDPSPEVASLVSFAYPACLEDQEEDEVEVEQPQPELQHVQEPSSEVMVHPLL
jgi:hypothetical protein